MQVSTLRNEYISMAPLWLRARDFADGQDKVKSKGTLYLPKLGSTQKDLEYDAFRLRADFYNATARTISGLSGMLFRKPGIFETGDYIEDISQNVSSGEDQINGYAQNAATEILTVGAGGGLVDFPRNDQGMTIADAERIGIAPIWAWYDVENIINWRYDTSGPAPRLVLVVLRETETVASDSDPFVNEVKNIYRVLRIDEAGYYSQQRFEETSTNQLANAKPVPSPYYNSNLGEYPAQQTRVSAVPVDDPYYPEANGERLREIPFEWFGYPEIKKPPLMDLINVNWKHYTVSADQAHGLHYAALPTPVVSGVARDEVPPEIGPLRTWVLEPVESKAYMLEAELPGMGYIEKKLSSLEWQMATLGARLLAPDVGNNETATAAAIRSSSDTSSLAVIADSVSSSMTKMLKITDMWLGGDGEDIRYELSKDFMPVPMDPQMLTSLLQSLQAGGISYQTYFENLKQGEIIRQDKMVEEEQDEIATGEPMTGQGDA